VVFSSHLFVHYFLPLALGLYFLAPRRAKNGVLLAVTFVFYGWINPAFTLLLIVAMLVDYGAGLALTGGWRRPWRGELPLLDQATPRTRFHKGVVAASVVSNLSLLAFFKYYNFGIDNFNAAVQALGLEHWAVDSTLRVALPLGISFYTFQAMSYAIDVYRGDARAMRNVVDFFAFEAMYPQLVAGPIVRFSEIAEQLRQRSHTLEKFARGSAFFALGLAKKILLANPCGEIADAAFGAADLTAPQAWLGVLAYAFQIYYDFSGYSDMALGLGLMLGFYFAKNFDSPYRALSLSDFWRRWHISLSTWLRDYLYIPLGGSRRGRLRTYFNLTLVMLLGGLWHGASWNFVVWGAIHGLGLAAERAAGGALWRRLPAVLQRAATFAVVLVAWVFFRAPDLATAGRYLGDLFGDGGWSVPAGALSLLLAQPYGILCLGLATAIAWGAPQTWDWTKTLDGRKVAASLSLLALALVAMATQGYNPFIYFIF
jgi:alginate O-acetyltransferase complex protein AlgI